MTNRQSTDRQPTEEPVPRPNPPVLDTDEEFPDVDAFLSARGFGTEGLDGDWWRD